MANVPARPRGESQHPSSLTQGANSVTTFDFQIPTSVNESDARLKALLDQQARIQAEIKALLPPKSGVDAQQELIMLKHKHKMLKSCQEEHGLASTVLSVEEECRLLQYKCECLEASCLQSGKYLSAEDLLEKGSLPLRSIQPSGFEDWLQTNATKYDPVLKQNSTGDAILRLKVSSSLKCPEQKCIHYIYGFGDPKSLENHRQSQHPTSKVSVEAHSSHDLSYLPKEPETGLRMKRWLDRSIEDVSERVQPPSAPQYPLTASKNPRITWKSVANPSRQNANQSSIDQPLLKTKTGCNTCKDRRVKCDETRPKCNVCVRSGRNCDGYSNTILPGIRGWKDVALPEPFPFIHEYGAYSDNHSNHSGSISSFPNKRPRLDLDDQDDTNLMKEVGPCLRCKILKKKCDIGDPCSLCPEQDSFAESDYWKVLGCHRGSLLSFRELLVPDKISSAHALKTTETFKCFAIHWWEQFQSQGGKTPSNPTDMQDEFGLTWPVQIQDHPDDRLEPLSTLIPPAYVLARRRNSVDPMDVGYSLVELLRFSGTISGSSLTECQSFPLLSLSKFLLQEAIVFQASHDPIYWAGAPFAYDRYDILSISCANFLRSFDDMTQRRGAWDPRKWTAAVCSLCFLRAAVCFLDDGFCFIEKEGRRQICHSNAIHSVYKALVSNFSWSTPSLLDDENVQMGLEDQDLLSGLKQVLLKDKWTEYGIPSTKDFLAGLGSGSFRDGFFNDFVLQKKFQYPHIYSPPKDNHDLISSPMSGVLSAALPLGLSRDTTPYGKPKHERMYCTQCEEHPDGFRGEHELRRHQDRAHKGMVKKWICVEPIGNHPQPHLPLSQCKACGVQQKKYGAYYNAAAHLRRTHFTPKARGRPKKTENRGGKGGGEWPPMSELKHWMQEIEEPATDGVQKATDSTLEDKDDMLSTTGSSMSLPYTNTTSRTSSPWFTSNRLNRIPGSAESLFAPMHGPQLSTGQSGRSEKCPISTCEYHTKGFARKNEKNRHLLSHYQGVIICPFCPGVGTPKEKTFSRADVLKRHLASAHNVEQAPPLMRTRSNAENVSGSWREKEKCSICGKGYEGAQEFYDHLEDCVLVVLAPAALTATAEEGPMSTASVKAVLTIED